LGLAVAEGSGKQAYTIAAGSDGEMAERVILYSNELFGHSRQSVVKIPAEDMARYAASKPGFNGFKPKEQYRPFTGGRLIAHILGNMVGHGAFHKHIPSPIFNANRSTQIAFLKSLIAGDGHIRVRPAKGQVEIGITTISPKLVTDTIFLCRQAGIWGCVGKHGDATSSRGVVNQKSYRITLSGGVNTRDFIINNSLKYSSRTAFEGIPCKLLQMELHTEKKRIKRVPYNETYPCGARVVPIRTQTLYQQMLSQLEDWAVLEVVGIEKVKPSIPYVYDLVVPGNHTFVAGTGLILVHNSGGETFRVNFAVRLALSEVLAQRSGARLQTLVIDEGFGSQDTLGRQRLIEAINMVSQDFEKILVITHIDELKDAFPSRIEVEKTDRGSRVRVW